MKWYIPQKYIKNIQYVDHLKNVYNPDLHPFSKVEKLEIYAGINQEGYLYYRPNENWVSANGGFSLRATVEGNSFMMCQSKTPAGCTYAIALLTMSDQKIVVFGSKDVVDGIREADALWCSQFDLYTDVPPDVRLQLSESEYNTLVSESDTYTDDPDECMSAAQDICAGV